jgi:hypothetical protein
MRLAAILALALASFGLVGARRLPPQTPIPGFYRIATLDDNGRVGFITLVCFTVGHGGTVFAEGRTPHQGEACGPLTVTRVGDGWDARQTCRTDPEGDIEYTATGRRQPDGELRVDYTGRPRSLRTPIPPMDTNFLRRISARCPAPLRPGEFLSLQPHPADGWHARILGVPALGGRLLTTLPPSIMALANDQR